MPGVAYQSNPVGRSKHTAHLVVWQSRISNPFKNF